MAAQAPDRDGPGGDGEGWGGACSGLQSVPTVQVRGCIVHIVQCTLHSVVCSEQDTAEKTVHNTQCSAVFCILQCTLASSLSSCTTSGSSMKAIYKYYQENYPLSIPGTGHCTVKLALGAHCTLHTTGSFLVNAPCPLPPSPDSCKFCTKSGVWCAGWTYTPVLSSTPGQGVSSQEIIFRARARAQLKT